MIYTKRDKLVCYSMPDQDDKIELIEFETVLMEHPSNVIYCEKNGKLYGIISVGDLRRAYREKKNYVKVNKSFTSVGTGEYMRAKWIFKDNEKINSLPIVNDMNELTGEYSRWEDLIALDKLRCFKTTKYGGGGI